jgi:adenosine kinase
VRIAVTGSIATDNLMTFPGKFSDQLVAGQLDQISLSFLVEGLEIRWGGAAANIAYGLGILGLRPLLLGAAGTDFDEYRSWLGKHGVVTDHVHLSAESKTARFTVTTDAAQNQIASFYPGAMSEAREISIGEIAKQVGGLDLVILGADDPEAMLKHTAEARDLGIAFIADPSQQCARMDGPQIRELFEGATYLIGNEYEKALAEEKTGWTDADVLDRVGTRITTLGEKGVRIDRKGDPSLHVPAVTAGSVGDPTGAGDAFRGGFLAGIAWGLPLERSAQFGNAVAVHALEAVGPQDYELDRDALLRRFTATYGEEAVGDIRPHLS